MTLAPPRDARTVGDVLGLCPDLAARYRTLVARLDGAGDLEPALLDRCRRRVARLVAGTAEAPGGPLDDRSAAAIDFCEQFVLDPHGVDEVLLARLRRHFAPRAIVVLAQALAVWEGLGRLARVYGVAVEL